MVLINYAGREINAKIVYYGPGLSGKTTNLECIYASVPNDTRGKMVSMKTRQDRTLFFDFLPLELGELHGLRARFLLYTVPGQVFYNATRKLVLKGADAVVFVADSSQGKMEENAESLRNLQENLRENNLSLQSIPWVIQYNKRDLPNVHSVAELQRALNPTGAPHFEASAATGRGVYETLHAVSRLLFHRLVKELRPAGAAPGATASPAAAPQWAGPAPGAATPNLGAAAAPNRVAPAAPAAAPGLAAPAPARVQAPAVSQAVQPTAPGQAFGVPGGNIPAEPTPDQIVDTVQATSRTMPDESEYGHVVDLDPQQADEAASGFIKDPLRRPQTTRESGDKEQVPATQTYRVPVTVSVRDFKPGNVIRLVLDLRVEP